MHPSTMSTATVGGFVCGGSGGVGSVNYGVLKDPGNIHSLRIVTMEEDPQVGGRAPLAGLRLLRDGDAQPHHHTHPSLHECRKPNMG